jgi:hypothetical protein
VTDDTLELRLFGCAGVETGHRRRMIRRGRRSGQDLPVEIGVRFGNDCEMIVLYLDVTLCVSPLSTPSLSPVLLIGVRGSVRNYFSRFREALLISQGRSGNSSTL